MVTASQEDVRSAAPHAEPVVSKWRGLRVARRGRGARRHLLQAGGSNREPRPRWRNTARQEHKPDAPSRNRLHVDPPSHAIHYGSLVPSLAVSSTNVAVPLYGSPCARARRGAESSSRSGAANAARPRAGAGASAAHAAAGARGRILALVPKVHEKVAIVLTDSSSPCAGFTIAGAWAGSSVGAPSSS